MHFLSINIITYAGAFFNNTKTPSGKVPNGACIICDTELFSSFGCGNGNALYYDTVYHEDNSAPL